MLDVERLAQLGKELVPSESIRRQQPVVRLQPQPLGVGKNTVRNSSYPSDAAAALR